MSETVPREAYEAPRLVVSGTLLDLTLGGVGPITDNAGIGSL